jgi:hypothetical protein
MYGLYSCAPRGNQFFYFNTYLVDQGDWYSSKGICHVRMQHPHNPKLTVRATRPLRLLGVGAPAFDI